MAGNAHRNRRSRSGAYRCPEGCVFCKARPKDGNYKNHNGHRRNTSRKKRQRNRKLNLETIIK